MCAHIGVASMPASIRQAQRTRGKDKSCFRSIEEYALVGTGETFKAAYVCLLGAAFFLGVAVPGIVRIVWKRKKRG